MRTNGNVRIGGWRQGRLRFLRPSPGLRRPKRVLPTTCVVGYVLSPLRGWTAEGGYPHINAPLGIPWNSSGPSLLRSGYQRVTASSGSGLAEGYALAFACVESKTFWPAK